MQTLQQMIHRTDGKITVILILYKKVLNMAVCKFDFPSENIIQVIVKIIVFTRLFLSKCIKNTYKQLNCVRAIYYIRYRINTKLYR